MVLLIIRYSGGPSEYRMSEQLPEVGAVMIHRDRTAWVVQAVDPDPEGASLVMLRRDESATPAGTAEQ